MEEDEVLPDFATPAMQTWETVLTVLGKMTDYASLEAKREYTRAYKAHKERERYARKKQSDAPIASRNVA